MAKNDFPKPTPAAPYPLGHAKENKDASAYTGFKYPSGGTGNDLNVYKQPMPSPNSLDITYATDPNSVTMKDTTFKMGGRRVSASNPGRQDVKTEGITIRGCGAATKGTKARGPMA